MDLGLTGKRVLAVGASKGLGRAIAQAFAEEGAQVVAAARSHDLIEAWRSELGPDIAARVAGRHLDLADARSIDRLADEMNASGGIDVLVNNCGGPPPGGVVGTSAEAWTRAFESMAAAVFRLTDRLVGHMVEVGWGRIITIGSSGIVQPIPNLALSNGVRAGVAAWSKSLSAEVARHGVTVNMVLPGRIDTDRVRSLDAARATRESASVTDVRAASAAEIPAGRYGRPDEFASVVVFLASERASYVTGSMIRIDGGLIRSL